MLSERVEELKNNPAQASEQEILELLESQRRLNAIVVFCTQNALTMGIFHNILRLCSGLEPTDA